MTKIINMQATKNKYHQENLLPQLALIYDFDGTLCDGNSQDYQLLPRLGYKEATKQEKFWQEINKYAEQTGADKVCVYMYELLKVARTSNIKLTKKLLYQDGKKVKVREGLEGKNNWFIRINKLAKRYGFTAKHYIISSGIGEIIEGTCLANWFQDGKENRIFASRYLYDSEGSAVAPSWVVNYTTKTQFLFRINKGVLDLKREVNDYMPDQERPVPFKHFIFIGDGFTDIPSFRVVRQNGGLSIAVCGEEKRDALKQLASLVNDGRVNAVSAEGNFKPGNLLEESIERFIRELNRK